MFESATAKLPLKGITAIPIGVKKLAAVPVPSANALLPLPASVVTTPRGVTTRIRWLSLSPTMMVPPEVTATPCGWLKLAAVPVPSMEGLPLPPPASVVTTPK